MGEKKIESRGGAARSFLGRLGMRKAAGPRHVLPAAVGIAAGILAGAFAVQVVGVTVVGGVAVGVVAAGYAFTKAWEVFIIRANAQPEGR